jgi:hypothetical protein
MMIQLVFSRINKNYGNTKFVYKRGEAKDYKNVDSVYPAERIVGGHALTVFNKISAVKNVDSIDEPMTIAPKWLKAFFYPQNFEKASSVTEHVLNMPEWLFKHGSPTFSDGMDCVRINVGESVSGTFFKFKRSDGTGRNAWGFFPHLNPSAAVDDPDTSIYEVLWGSHWLSYNNLHGANPLGTALWREKKKNISAGVPTKFIEDNSAVLIPRGPVLDFTGGFNEYLDETPNTRPYVPLWTSADITVYELMDKVKEGTIWDMLVVTDKPLVELTTVAESMTKNPASQEEIEWALFYRNLARNQFKTTMGAIIEFDKDGDAEFIRAAFTDLAII